MRYLLPRFSLLTQFQLIINNNTFNNINNITLQQRRGCSTTIITTINNNYNNNTINKMARILQPNEKNMEEAAELIKNGGLVSFPTETGILKKY